MIEILLAIGGLAPCGCGAGFDRAADAGDPGGTDAGAGDTDLPPPPPEIQGVLRLRENYVPGMMGGTESGASADFYLPEEFALPEQIAAVGTCFAYDSAEGIGNLGPTLDAGDILVSGGARELTFEYRTNAYGHDSLVGVWTIFDEGDVLVADAAGGADVPAFTGEVVAPADMRVLAPFFSGTPRIERSEDFVVEWEAAESGEIFLLIDSEGTSVSCRAPDADGRIVVPSEILSHLGPTPDGAGMMDGAMLMISRVSRETLIAGPAIVSLEVEAASGAMAEVR